ncbi:hypothetical protein CC78DRAFT_528184 [Lojkania enalia]|uniref:Transcriptional regulatory protein DEP1 n=1 Tax=Lojkania enalia TaxID=147567 RepID=A0A9P4TRA5_9PLEO|nr:hypothetical protein CC78DRAFT_528184 [Didymosphaeria enalia]
MSVLQRVRRSRSKTAPETRRDFVQSNGTIPTSTSDLSTPSSIPTPQPLAVPASEMGTELQSIPDSSTEIMEALSTSQLLEETPSATIAMTTIKERLEDHPDNGSSSLSELGDASDDHSEPTPRASVVAEPTDNDSEAETERLEATPRKLTRTATSTSMASEQPYERTPSKLAYSKAIDQDDSIPPTPSVTAKDAIAIETGDDSALHALSIVAASEGASLADIAGKKRKRSSAETSSADEPTDEPARKRSGTARDTTLNGSPKDLAVPSEHLDVEEVLSHAEERISQLAREEADLEERQADVVIEAVSEIATVAKLTKPRKGGRKGKRKAEEAADTINELVAEAQEGEVDGEHDDEDSGALDEESVKKKHAISQLAKIEKKFKIFREKLCDEQIARYEQELEMLKQPNCIHPEYLTMIQSIDERRNEKIAYERQLLQYKQKCLEIRTVAERHQLHSQYFQTVRDLREKSLEECNQRIYDLQRGRRQLGVEDIQYSIKLPEKRSEQIRQQAAYNLEVSILSGVAKYVGFPAAPDIRPARPSEIEDDFRAMKVRY